MKRTTLDAFSPIQGIAYASSAGCAPLLEDKHILGYISDGSWAHYEVLDFGQGASYFQARISTPLLGGSIEILLADDPAGSMELLGNCAVPDSGGWQSWIQIYTPILTIDGVHAITLRFHKPVGSGSLSLFEIDCFSFAASAAGIVRDPASRIPSAQADSLSANINTRPSGDLDGGDATVDWSDGNAIAFARINLEQGCDWFEARVWIAERLTRLEIHLIDLEAGDDSLAGKLQLLPLEGTPTWQTLGCQIQAAGGRKILELIFRSPVLAPDFRLNWVRLSTLKRRPGPAWDFDAGPLIACNWNTAHHVQQEPCSEGGHNIGYLRDGSFIGFDQIDFGVQSRCQVAVRVAAGSTGGSISIQVDGRSLATIIVPGTGDWQNWMTISADLVSEVRGIHRLECHFHGEDAFLFNLQWIDFPSTQAALDGGTRPIWNVSCQAKPVPFNHPPELIGDTGRSGTGALVRLALRDIQNLLHIQGQDFSFSQQSDKLILHGQRGRLELRHGSSQAAFFPANQGPSMVWKMPDTCESRDGQFWLPAQAFLPLSGLMSRWDPQLRHLDIRIADRHHLPRGRVSNHSGTLLGDRGQVLRGPTLQLDEVSLPSFSQLDMIGQLGFNCLHVLVESPVGAEIAPRTIATLDELVEYTGQNGLYLILAATCGSLPGWYDGERLTKFWHNLAPRYAHHTQVIYELARQPHPWSDPYPTALIELERQLLNFMDNSAPDSHVLIFSYANLSQPETVLRDLHALHLRESQRGRVSVAWVGFDRHLERITSCLKVLRRQGWSSINTEIPARLRDASQAINPRSPDLDMIKLCEANQTGWTASLPVNLLASPEVWQAPALAAGITWPSEG